MTKPSPPAQNSAWRGFWLTIVLLLIVTVGLAIIGWLRGHYSDQPPAELPRQTLTEILLDSAVLAGEETLPELDDILDEVYEPVYAAIPAYADFHYTVAGEYTELLAYAQGEMAELLAEMLLGGFEQRMNRGILLFDQKYTRAYQNALDRKIEEAASSERELGSITQTILADAQSRMKVSITVFTGEALVGSGILKAAFAGIAKKLAGKLAVKTGGKIIATGTGAGAGVAVCAWAGPFALACV